MAGGDRAALLQQEELADESEKKLPKGQGRAAIT